MKLCDFLTRKNTGLIVVDAQEKLFAKVEGGEEIAFSMSQVIRGFQILGLPIFVTEQYPKGLGPTIPSIKELFGEEQKIYEKTTFSCFGNMECKEKILSLSVRSWVLIGIEAHVCILQTAKDLLLSDKGVVVCSNAISARSMFDYLTAVEELRDCGARITSAETVLFEIVGDSKADEFKAIQKLIKESPPEELSE